MNTQQAGLYERVRSFAFDAPGTTRSFAERLAQENGWSTPFAERVIDEYRKFAFLAAAAGHPVSPSDAVDQAWHLHLVYTRSYWDEFCDKTLGMKLHHEPGRGARGEREKFDDWYARTLDSYRRLLGEEPPVDIWPSPEVKSKTVERHRRVDLERHWIVPRKIVRSAVGVAVALALAVLILIAASWRGVVDGPGVTATSTASPWAFTLNPFDVRGPQFLAFFFVALVPAFVLAAAARLRARESAEPIRSLPQKLDAYQIAYLNNGPAHAVNAAVATLVHRGALRDNRDGTLAVDGALAPRVHPLEEAVYASVRVNGTKRTRVKDVRAWAAGETRKMGDTLRTAGLLVSERDARRAVKVATLTALSVPAIGVIKIFVGIYREKPVGFLVLACAVSAAAAMIAFARRPHRTHRGDAELDRLKATH